MNCRHVVEQIPLYVDGELQATESLQVESHLVECAACRGRFESLSSVVETVRAARPLYQIPEASLQAAEQKVRAHRSYASMWRMAAAATVLFTAAGLWYGLRTERDRFAVYAAESHLRYTRGALALDIHTGEPAEVSNWLSARMPFHVTLPNYPDQPGLPKKYSLLGARLLQYQEDDVAYLVYQMGDKPISLLIGSSARIVPAGGNVYRSGGLSFHTTSHNGLKMITWVDKGLSYALVSDLRAVGAESCAVCHGSEEEQHMFAPLKGSQH